MLYYELYNGWMSVESSDMHMPFNNAQSQMIEEKVTDKGDMQLLLFIKFLYYLFLRPGIELRFLQIKDIKLKTILVRSSRAKNNKGQHVVIPTDMEQIIQELKLRSYPLDYYVFSTSGQLGETPVGVNYFYKRHRKLLDELALIDGHTPSTATSIRAPLTSTRRPRTCWPCSATAGTPAAASPMRTCASTG